MWLSGHVSQKEATGEGHRGQEAGARGDFCHPSGPEEAQAGQHDVS